MPEKYIAYLRVSTKEQGRSGLGLEAQKRDINLFILNHASEGDLLGTYTDIISGADSSREELTEAITKAKQLNATLIVSKLDRLSRKVSFIATLMEDKLLKFKVASMPHADKFQLHIYAALAEQERDFISIRTKAALSEKKAAGAVLGGLRDVTNKRNKVKAKIADDIAIKHYALICPLRASGLSYREIAHKLNSAGLTTSTNKRFYAQTIANMVVRVEKMNN